MKSIKLNLMFWNRDTNFINAPDYWKKRKESQNVFQLRDIYVSYYKWMNNYEFDQETHTSSC